MEQRDEARRVVRNNVAHERGFCAVPETDGLCERDNGGVRHVEPPATLAKLRPERADKAGMFGLGRCVGESVGVTDGNKFIGGFLPVYRATLIEGEDRPGMD